MLRFSPALPSAIIPPSVDLGATSGASFSASGRTTGSSSPRSTGFHNVLRSLAATTIGTSRLGGTRYRWVCAKPPRHFARGETGVGRRRHLGRRLCPRRRTAGGSCFPRTLPRRADPARPAAPRDTRAALDRVYAATGDLERFLTFVAATRGKRWRTARRSPISRHAAFSCRTISIVLLSGRLANELSIASNRSCSTCIHGLVRVLRSSSRIPAEWFSPPVLAGTKSGRCRVCRSSRARASSPCRDTTPPRRAIAGRAGRHRSYLATDMALVGFESDSPVLGGGGAAARISNERTGDGRLTGAE